ncbi:MAG: hypothetical protein J6T74_02185 [Clostridia bacterium]|nr:hypothetical protein [Clostridia bacterium]
MTFNEFFNELSNDLLSKGYQIVQPSSYGYYFAIDGINFYWISLKTSEIGYTIDFSDDWFYVRYVFQEKKLNELKTQASKFVEDMKKKRIENKLKELEKDFV